MFNGVKALKDVMWFALLCFLVHACVPALTDVKTDDIGKKKDEKTDTVTTGKSLENDAESKQSVNKEKPSDTKKDAIRDDWHARRIMAVEKEKKSLQEKRQREIPKGGKRNKTINTQSEIEKSSFEEDKIKKAAVEILKGLNSPIKYTICYDQENEEWWLTVYDDIGHALDVKQYFWTPAQEKLEPFLVLKKIPKSRLNNDISMKSDQKKCSIYEPERSSSGKTSVESHEK